MKIWDMRKNYDCLFKYYTEKTVNSLDVSQTGLIGIGMGDMLQIWKNAHIIKQKMPYMKQIINSKNKIRKLEFLRFEDVIGIGHTGGFSSFIIPGSGFPQ